MRNAYFFTHYALRITHYALDLSKHLRQPPLPGSWDDRVHRIVYGDNAEHAARRVGYGHGEQVVLGEHSCYLFLRVGGLHLDSGGDHEVLNGPRFRGDDQVP